MSTDPQNCDTVITSIKSRPAYCETHIFLENLNKQGKQLNKLDLHVFFTGIHLLRKTVMEILRACLSLD